MSNFKLIHTIFWVSIKYLDVIAMHEYAKVNILCLSETWLTNANESAFPITGFQPIIYNSRKDNSGRGV